MTKLALGFALVVALSMSLIACGGPPSVDTGILGLTITRPVGHPASSPLPEGFGPSYGDVVSDPHEEVEIVAASFPNDGKTVATVESDENGVFTVALPPGDYHVRGPLGSDYEEGAHVAAGQLSRVMVHTGTP